MLTNKLKVLNYKQFWKLFSTVPVREAETNFEASLNSDNCGLEESNALENPDYFNVHNLFTVKDLFDARVHYGHKITSLNDRMKPFLFGSRLGHLIFDLDVTAHHLRQALNFIAHVAYRDGVILFISRNPEVTLLVEKTAQECQEYAVARNWRFGIFANSEKKFKSVVRLPDLCIFLNTYLETGFQHPGVKEAAIMCIPTVGVVDSNCDPNLITYPIPGNDDSYATIKFYLNLFKKTILIGKDKRKQDLLKKNSVKN